ncbi:MAG: RNA 2',3'-cyclic phosphodiesterase [Draconibacterium sp.]|jgi:2'-5' RNA ligase
MEKRTFIAVKIKPEKQLLNLISELRTSLGSEKLNWVEEFNLHVTLHFIGETTLLQVQAVIEMLRLKTMHTPVFTLNFTGIGFFGSKNQPKVLFVSAEKNRELEQIVGEIAKGLSKLGLPGNQKFFSPHLTLARIKAIQNPQLFWSIVEKYKNQYFQSAEVSEIICYESILQPAGPVYKPIQTFKLK